MLDIGTYQNGGVRFGRGAGHKKSLMTGRFMKQIDHIPIMIEFRIPWFDPPSRYDIPYDRDQVALATWHKTHNMQNKADMFRAKVEEGLNSLPSGTPPGEAWDAFEQVVSTCL